MSWWDIGSNRVLGDRPADVVTLALNRIAEARAAAGRPLPDLPGLLDGISRALPDETRLVGRLADGTRVPAAVNADVEDVAIEFRDVFAEIDRLYRERWERGPDPYERSMTVLFTIRGGTEGLVDDPRADQLDAFEETG
jgi:hypothetical protein